jgi:hypothetical protein
VRWNGVNRDGSEEIKRVEDVRGNENPEIAVERKVGWYKIGDNFREVSIS